jgi:hypothetical protein
MKQKTQKGNGVIIFIIVVALIWGAYSLFTPNSKDDYSYKNNNSSYDYKYDGYEWAEENDISSFEECQDQFGTSYEEDACNDYVKENYSGYDTFYGYNCTEDCSGHNAGYNWAEENGIYDEYDCDGNSNSFNEGCMAYVEENY